MNSLFVIRMQLESAHVFSTLIVWGHDGLVSGGMAQAQCVTELVHCNCEQVDASAGNLGSVKQKCY